MRYREIFEGGADTVLITSLYTPNELMDEKELISQYAPPIDWNIPLTIHTMHSDELKNLENSNANILNSFRNANKTQRDIVKRKIEHFDHERIVVLYGKEVIDGNHHIIAAIRAKKSIRYIDLSEWD